MPETLFTQDEESTASPFLTPPGPSPLISTFFRGAANTMPSHSPPLALNHCWDNERVGGGHHHRHHLHPSAPPYPQTDTSFIEILWSSNPPLPPGAIMDSLRQPFPAGLSSKPAWVTSPPLQLMRSSAGQRQPPPAPAPPAAYFV